MVNDEQAGIHCINCGHEEIAANEDESELLSKSLFWSEEGDPLCPSCEHAVTYENYIT